MDKNYQVLARKYRPKNFGQMVGQDHITKALANAIDTGRLHHAYLFTGTRGVGKTTIARILSKCLNCETGITSMPCGECNTCQAINNGQFIDLIEIDAASRTKVEDTRDLLETIPYAPVQGRYKVYLIDEVHMLSTHSFNALLKTLEEPPEHVKFLFATTDPQKLPITIVSRCLQFVLRPLSQSLLTSHLSSILNLEAIEFKETALWQIAGSAKGSVRDALSLTDQAIAFGGGKINDNTVNQMLGLIDGADTLKLLSDIYFNHKNEVAMSIAKLRSQLSDAPSILEKLIELTHQLAMIQILPDLPLDMNDNDKSTLMALSEQMPAEVLQLYYEILINAKENLKFANTPMQGLEMAILRLLAFRPLTINEVSVNETIIDNNVSLVKNLIEPDDTNDSNENFDNQTTLNNEINSSDNENFQPIIENLTENKAFENNTADNGIENLNSEHLTDETVICQELNDEATVVNINENNLSDNELNHQLNDDLENVSPPIINDSIDNDELLDNTSDYQQLENHTNALLVDELSNQTLENDAFNQENLLDTQTDKLLDESLANETLINDNIINDAKIDKTTITENLSNLPIHSLQAQLNPPPCDLTGEWTVEKWDYWTHNAYQSGFITADEFAMAQYGQIAGDINGQATLSVASIQYQIEVSFKHLKEKMAQLFGAIVMLAESEIDQNTTPNARHQYRLASVRQQAEQNLIHSPVMNALSEQGFLVGGAGLENLRLSFG